MSDGGQEGFREVHRFFFGHYFIPMPKRQLFGLGQMFPFHIVSESKRDTAILTGTQKNKPVDHLVMNIGCQCASMNYTISQTSAAGGAHKTGCDALTPS